MLRIFGSALLACALYLPASADPIAIAPDAYAASQSWNRAAPSTPRTVQIGQQLYMEVNEPNMGGGFIEFLFGGPSQQGAAQRPYQPAPPAYQPPPATDQSSAPGQPAFDPSEPPQQGYLPSSDGDLAHRPIDPKYERQVVDYHGTQSPGTIIIDTPEKYLFLVEDSGKALRYGIGVGRPGFTWAGVKEITAKREWPDWRPPDDMLKRRPDLPRYMAGGPENPLGARAMYLGSTLYRIHGSNEPWTIGTEVSSGCIRMRNQDVIDLYNRVKVGTKVVVI